MEIKRYAILGIKKIYQPEDGEWCKYEDMEKLVRENEILKEAIGYYLCIPKINKVAQEALDKIKGE